MPPTTHLKRYDPSLTEDLRGENPAWAGSSMGGVWHLDCISLFPTVFVLEFRGIVRRWKNNKRSRFWEVSEVTSLSSTSLQLSASPLLSFPREERKMAVDVAPKRPVSSRTSFSEVSDQTRGVQSRFLERKAKNSEQIPEQKRNRQKNLIQMWFFAANVSPSRNKD